MRKRMLKAIGIALALVCVLMLGCFINHRIRLNGEKGLLKPLGTLVDVDGAKMSVYAEGEGEPCLVFLSGSGTCSPILDFKSLYSLLSDEYRIAVVERFGYGFSDVTSKSRDIDTILENTREALRQAELPPPYVLCPHSMSGIEALHWAQKYPDEVAAIIGLDMSVPAAYEELQVNPLLTRLLQFGASIGVTRIGNLSESAAIRTGTLTAHEKAVYRALFFARTMTNDMLNETASIKESAQRVGDAELPDIPILLFCSNGSSGTGFSKERWRRIQADFAAENDCELLYLDCGHYVHDEEYAAISEAIKAFLKR